MPILGVIASSRQTAVADLGAYYPLQVISVGASGASSVTFSNIPSTYSHLQIRVLMRTQTSQDSFIRFNGDTNANYSFHFLVGNGDVTASGGFANNTSIGWKTVSGTADIFTVAVVDILDYANTNKFKTTRSFAGDDLNGSGALVLHSGNWRNTNAITSITMSTASTSFSQFSQFALYGVKSA